MQPRPGVRRGDEDEYEGELLNLRILRNTNSPCLLGETVFLDRYFTTVVHDRQSFRSKDEKLGGLSDRKRLMHLIILELEY